MFYGKIFKKINFICLHLMIFFLSNYLSVCIFQIFFIALLLILMKFGNDYCVGKLFFVEWEYFFEIRNLIVDSLICKHLFRFKFPNIAQAPFKKT